MSGFTPQLALSAVRPVLADVGRALETLSTVQDASSYYRCLSELEREVARLNDAARDRWNALAGRTSWK